MSSLNGRGGIRTHGGFPHARFRVECLKPDSATLPIARYCRLYFRMRNFRVSCPLSDTRPNSAAGFTHSPVRSRQARSRIKSEPLTPSARGPRQTELIWLRPMFGFGLETN